MRINPKDDRALRVGDIVYLVRVGRPGKIRSLSEKEIEVEWCPSGLRSGHSSLSSHSHEKIRLFEPFISRIREKNAAVISTASGKRLERAVNLKRKIDEKFELFEEAKRL